MDSANDLTFDDFKAQWLETVQAGNPSTVLLSQRFVEKMLEQRFGFDDQQAVIENLYLCDGSCDGGIDAAYLERAEPNENDAGPATEQEESESGNTWYLIQSKYGSAFQGNETLFEEGRKILDTLDGTRTNLASATQQVLVSIEEFRRTASEQDRIKLLFFTVNALADAASQKAINDLRILGQNRLGGLFDVESYSVEDVFQSTQPEPEKLLSVPISGNLFQAPNSDLLAGTVSLMSLYAFLKDFRQKTNCSDSLEKLYEKNVRLYLGARGKKSVNFRIKETLETEPERFGLYNNGITIVVKDFVKIGENTFDLVEPYVVNGCQTTKTIYDFFYPRLESGGTSTTAPISDWRVKADKGVVVVKIVKVGENGEILQENITRFTNTQNTIRDKDFMALNSTLRTWSVGMEAHGVFLELQKGGWDARKALQKKKSKLQQFTDDDYANAFDLLKTYGAGWLGEAGAAWQQNQTFLPGGTTFARITQSNFGTNDLLAAFQLQKITDSFEFGRRAKRDSRKVTRFLFYFVAVQMLKDIVRQDKAICPPEAVTQALLGLSKPENLPYRKQLMNAAIQVIDTYMNSSSPYSVYNETDYQKSNNLNTFLKSDKLGKDPTFTPHLNQLMQMFIGSLGLSMDENAVPPLEAIKSALQN